MVGNLDEFTPKLIQTGFGAVPTYAHGTVSEGLARLDVISQWNKDVGFTIALQSLLGDYTKMAAEIIPYGSNGS